MKILFIFNNNTWKTIPTKIEAVKKFFAPKIAMQIDVQYTNFTNIPFETVSVLDGTGHQDGTDVNGKSETVKGTWYDQNITSRAKGYDVVLFCITDKDKEGHLTSSGIRGDMDQGPAEIVIFGGGENWENYVNGVSLGNNFVVIACHEISHAIYMIRKIKDNTHLYFYSGHPEKVLEDFNFVLPPNDRTKIIQELLNYCLQLLGLLNKQKDTLPVPTPLPPAPEKPKYDWSTPEKVSKTVRIMCDEAGLTVTEKDTIWACVKQESQFIPRAIGKINYNGTKDYGLCQFNDGKNKQGIPYWIGPGADFKDIEEVLSNPEKNMRVMLREFKRGNLKWWASFSTGAYKKHLPYKG